MKYIAKSHGEKTVQVTLYENDGEVSLVAGDWAVVTLTRDGTVKFDGGIPKDNDAGLQVDIDGEVILK